MVWYKPWRVYINRNKRREIDSLVNDFFGLEHRLFAIGQYNDEGKQIPIRMQGIRTKIQTILNSMGSDAPPDPIEVIYERRKVSRDSDISGSSGDSAFERRCQERVGQRYSASEICGGGCDFDSSESFSDSINSAEASGIQTGYYNY